MAGRKATWDTGYGYELYLQGKSDAEIADACRVQTGAVTSYRVKRWAKMPDGGRVSEPAAAEELTEEIATSSPVGTPRNDVVIQGTAGDAGEGETGMKKIIVPDALVQEITAPVGAPARNDADALGTADGVAGLTAGAALEAMEDPAEVEAAEPYEVRFVKEMRRKLDLVAEATEDMSGIRAICTAGAIEALWKWEDREALHRARAYIDYMIEQNCHGYG